jgi:thioredoxin reductase
MADADLLVIGGGPAGMAAATITARHGLRVIVIDEQQRPGGQILRQPPHAFRVGGWLDGRTYRDVKAILAAFEAEPDIQWCGGRSVLGLAREEGVFVAHAAGADDMVRVTADRVLVATGCYDLPVPLRGWTLPGVLAAGGVQAFIKSQQFVPGRRFVLAGTHPLMLVIAAQIVAAGGNVALVAFDQSRARAMAPLLAHPLTVLRNIGTFAAAASALRTLRRYGVPIRYGMPLTEIIGEGEVCAAGFGTKHVSCDRIALCYGFVPQSDLPRLSGASTAWAGPAGGWRTLHDASMATDVEGLWIAGETGGVDGAAIAIEEGRLAAFGILRSTGRLPEGDGQAMRSARRLSRLRRFSSLLAEVADPGAALSRAQPDDTILCRCEDVSFGAVFAALEETLAPNAVKLLTRCGMGLCQGRSCEPALLRLIAARSGREIGSAGGFAARFPVRPVRIGDLIEPACVAATATNSSGTID